jgi:hypothetical protein
MQANVSYPILGVDFLCSFQLLVDVVSGRLIQRSTVTADGSGEVLRPSAQHQMAAAAASSAAAGSTEAPLQAVGSSRSKSSAETVKGGTSTVCLQLEAAAAAVTAKREWHRMVV